MPIRVKHIYVDICRRVSRALQAAAFRCAASIPSHTPVLKCPKSHPDITIHNVKSICHRYLSHPFVPGCPVFVLLIGHTIVHNQLPIQCHRSRLKSCYIFRLPVFTLHSFSGVIDHTTLNLGGNVRGQVPNRFPTEPTCLLIYGNPSMTCPSVGELPHLKSSPRLCPTVERYHVSDVYPPPRDTAEISMALSRHQ